LSKMTWFMGMEGVYDIGTIILPSQLWSWGIGNLRVSQDCFSHISSMTIRHVTNDSTKVLNW
jgi:hypothetical protein